MLINNLKTVNLFNVAFRVSEHTLNYAYVSELN